MRLTCPNCSAQYEIDATLIPDEGRDVQCSNCGNTWFEAKKLPPDPALAKVDWDAADASQDDDDEITDDSGQAVADASPEPEPESAQVEDLGEDNDDDDDGAVGLDDLPDRRPIDPKAIDVLRAEAEREIAARRGTPQPIETQAEAALDDDVEDQSPSHAWRARVSRIEDAEEIEKRAQELDEKAAYSRVKSDLLPDIEDINSSLAPAAAASAPKGSFRTGFVGAIGIAALLLILYIAAPTIAGIFPATEGFFVAYLDAANAARDLIGGSGG